MATTFWRRRGVVMAAVLAAKLARPPSHHLPYPVTLMVTSVLCNNIPPELGCDRPKCLIFLVKTLEHFLTQNQTWTEMSQKF